MTNQKTLTRCGLLLSAASLLTCFQILLSSKVLAFEMETDSESPPIAQADLATVTDVQLNPTADGLSIVLVSEQPLTAGESTVSGNTLITEITNAVLELPSGSMFEEFGPTDDIAYVQVSNLENGNIRIAVTGATTPPVVATSAQADTFVLNVTRGTAMTNAEDTTPIQVVVTATRTEENVLDVPRSVTIIDQEEIERQLTFTNNLPDILGNLVPGLGAPPRDGSTIFLRLRGRPITVLIDGVPQTPNNNTFSSSLNTIDPAQIERIEVLRGPSAIYGDGATGGIINIITKRASEEPLDIDIAAGFDTSLTTETFDESDRFGYSGQVDLSAANERVDGLLSLSYDVVDGQFDAEGNRILPNGLNENERLGLLAKFGVNITEQQRLGLTYSFFRQLDNTEYTFDTAVANDPDAEFGRAIRIGDNGADYEERPRQINHVVDLTYRNENILGSQLDLQAFYRDTNQVGVFTDIRGPGLLEIFPPLWQTTLDDVEYGGRLQIDSPIGSSANLLWGVDYSRNETESPLLVSNTDDLDENQEVNIIDDSLDRFPSYDLENLGLFAQASWDITDQVEVSGGIRYENIDYFVEDFDLAFRFPREREGGSGSVDDVAFNAGVVYNPIPEIGLFASFAQGFSIPDLGSSLQGVPQTFDISSDLLLEPQKVNNYELGFRASFERIQTTVSGFFNDSELGVGFVIDPETGFPVANRSPQRNYGVEVTVDWQPTDTWRLGNLFSWSEGEDDINDDGDFLPLSTIQVQPFKFGLYIENDTAPGWTNRLDMLIIGRRRRSVNEGIDTVEAGGYTTVDFSSNIKIGRGQLTVGIANLFNVQYLPVGEQLFLNVTQRSAAPGRTLHLRYSMDF
ncbi:MAG: TonB-dependent receptor [Synechococcales bacterium]|nr:TonB-dependent receptor [Synechococcales bacterium]